MPVSDRIKRAIVSEVRGTFHDRARGERPVVRKDDGLFGRGAVAWRVHADVTTMMVGGVAALLLQMLHPSVLAGVWDHSNFREDMLGRLRRTARFIAMTTYGSRDEAEAAIERVRSVHQQVRGTLPDGTPYDAGDPRLLAWVHVTETTSFLNAWIRYAESSMTLLDQDRYFSETAQIAGALGTRPVVTSRSEARRLIQSMRSELRYDDRTRDVSRLLLAQRAPSAVGDPVLGLIFRAAIDLLPPWAQRMHRLSAPLVTRPLVRVGTLGVAQTIRWAFR